MDDLGAFDFFKGIGDQIKALKAELEYERKVSIGLARANRGLGIEVRELLEENEELRREINLLKFGKRSSCG